MWDIKSIACSDSRLLKNRFYLNHVGYKEYVYKKAIKHLTLFYLNHVGYKAEADKEALKQAIQFYLNHVGYKALIICSMATSS